MQPQNPRFRECTHGIDEKWYFLFVPLAALSWSGLFCPHVKNFLSMTLHGVLAYTIVYILTKYNVSYSSVLFASASLVSLSAGILSRFNCRQAIGNTISGFYVLLPGAYLVSGLYSTRWSSEFFTDIIVQAITIGIGGWTGTVICSPAILGSVYALRLSQKAIPSVLRKHVSKRRRRFQDEGEEGSDDSDEPMPTMLHF